MSLFNQMFNYEHRFKFNSYWGNLYTAFINDRKNKKNILNQSIENYNNIYNNNTNTIDQKKYEIFQLDKLIKKYSKQLESNSNKILSSQKIVKNHNNQHREINNKIFFSFLFIIIFSILIIILLKQLWNKFSISKVIDFKTTVNAATATGNCVGSTCIR